MDVVKQSLGSRNKNKNLYFLQVHSKSYHRELFPSSDQKHDNNSVSCNLYRGMSPHRPLGSAVFFSHRCDLIIFIGSPVGTSPSPQ